MAQPSKPVKKSEPVTKGTLLGARLRSRANAMTDAEREAARQRGMQLIYGDAGGSKVHAAKEPPWLS